MCRDPGKRERDSTGLPTLIMTTKRLSALEQRWVNGLSQFDFDIKFRPGRDNTAADILSRLKHRKSEHDNLSDEEVREVLSESSNSTAIPPKIRKLAAEIGLQEAEVDFESQSTALPRK